MKLLKCALSAALILVKYVLPATFIFVFLAIVTLRFFLYDPSACYGGEYDDRRTTNGNGDVVTEYFRACTGLGTIVDYWLVLTTRDGKHVETLITFPRRRPDYPKVYWVTNHDLHIDIGPVHTFWPGLSKVGPIRISYAHSYDEREDE